MVNEYYTTKVWIESEGDIKSLLKIRCRNHLNKDIVCQSEIHIRSSNVITGIKARKAVQAAGWFIYGDTHIKAYCPNCCVPMKAYLVYHRAWDLDTSWWKDVEANIHAPTAHLAKKCFQEIWKNVPYSKITAFREPEHDNKPFPDNQNCNCRYCNPERQVEDENYNR